MKGEKYMKRPMKLLSILTSASLALSGLSAMAIPMTAYANTQYNLASVTVSDGAGASKSLDVGYTNEEAIDLTIVETYETAESEEEATILRWEDTAITGVTSEDSEMEAEAYAAKFDIGDPDGEATLNEEAKTATHVQALTISDGLTAGTYVVAIGVGAKTADYTVIVSEASTPDPVTYEAAVTPATVKLNATTNEKEFTVSVTSSDESEIPTGTTYAWTLSGSGAFKFPENAETDNDSITVTFDEAMYAEILESDPEAEFTATLKATVSIPEESDIEATATITYGEDEEEPSDEPSKPSQDEEKKDETKKDDTSKAPAPAGTEIKGEQATYKVTGAGEAEYEAPKDATASTVVIPDEIKDANGNVYKVTAVAPNAFKKNKKVKTAKFGKYVTTIGAGAFDGASNLKNLELNGNVVKTIGKNAFRKTKKGLKVKIFAKNKKTAQKLFNKVVKKGKAKGAVLKFKKRK